MIVSLLVACININTHAQNSTNNDTITLYFDCPKDFTKNDTVECTLWNDTTTTHLLGTKTENSLYKFTIPEFSTYQYFVFDNLENTQMNIETEFYLTDEYRTTVDFIIKDGIIYLDRNFTLTGIPNNLVLTNQVYYQSSNMSYPNKFYARGEWLTLTKWHRSNTFYKYLDTKGALFPDILPEEQIVDLWYMYDELYHYNDTQTNDSYYLIFGVTPQTRTEQIYEIYGNYIIRSKESYAPDAFGYFIYHEEYDNYLTLKEAINNNIQNIDKVFTEYGLGELIGDVDCDRTISILDATCIQRCLAKLEKYRQDDLVLGTSMNVDEKVFYISDFDRDGQRTILDATNIQRYLACF